MHEQARPKKAPPTTNAPVRPLSLSPSKTAASPSTHKVAQKGSSITVRWSIRHTGYTAMAPHATATVKHTAVAQHPTKPQYSNGLDQRHDNPGGGKSRRSANRTGPQSKREHDDGHARRLVVYEVTVRENPMSEADRGPEPDAVVVLEVLVQLPQPEQLVPAHSKAESGGHTHDQCGDRKATSLQHGRDVAPRAFYPGPRTAVMGQDA